MKDTKFHHKKWEDLELKFFSLGGEETFFYLPQQKIALDIGRGPSLLFGAKKIFLTHCHIDHIGGLPFYARNRSLHKKEKTKVYLPAPHASILEEIFQKWGKIDGKKYPLSFQPLETGQEIELGKHGKIKTFPTFHSIPSLGYQIYHKVEKLKPQYSGLSFSEISHLKQQGEELTTSHQIPFLAYTGDTSAQVFEAYPEIFSSKYLILECTFIGKKDSHLASKYGHIHLDEIGKRAHLFQNEQILLFHFSSRYAPKEIQYQVRTRLPESLWSRIHLCI